MQTETLPPEDQKCRNCAWFYRTKHQVTHGTCQYHHDLRRRTDSCLNWAISPATLERLHQARQRALARKLQLPLF